MIKRKQIGIKLPEELIPEIDAFCNRNSMSRTYYIETLIRTDLKKRGLFPKKQANKQTYYTCDIEDMPLEPIHEN